MRTLLVLPLVVLGLGAAPARAGQPSAPPNPLPRWISAFTDSLYGAVRQRPGNLFLSPFSVHAALSMAREGAAGETASEMDAALHLPQGGAGDGYLRLTTALKPPPIQTYDRGSVPAFSLSVANALWAKTGFEIDPGFASRLKDLHGSPVTRVDFSDRRRAREIIHAWVSKETRGKIPTILPDSEPAQDTRLILTNAVYFKAAWLSTFSEGATEDGPFRRQDGTEVKARLMNQEDHFGYGETDLAQVLELPYVGNALSMFVVLPKAKDGLPALEERTKPSDALAGLRQHTLVKVTLPKFTFTWQAGLVDALKSLGMRRAFDLRNADFSRMSAAEPLFIGLVAHKAFVEVNEEGTEAAAVTAIPSPSAAPGLREPPKPIVFRADHPFQLLIVHRATGTILFVGRVVDPS